MDEDLTRWDLIWGGAVLLGLQTVSAALVLAALLTALWAGALAVLLWIPVILRIPSLLERLGQRHAVLASLSPVYRRVALVYALIMGYAAGTLGLTVLLGGVRAGIFGEEVQLRELLFDVALVVYMVTASLPALLLLLAVPAWLVGWVDPWGLRFTLGLLGFGASAMGAVVLIYGPVQWVSNAGRTGVPPGPETTGVPAPLLFWGLYGLITLLSVLTALALSRWEGLRRPGQGGRRGPARLG